MSLGPEDEDLLSKARHGLGPTARDRARVRAALGAGIAATMAPAAAAAVGAGKMGFVLKIVGIAVVALAAFGAVALTRSPPPATAMPIVEAGSSPAAVVVADPPPAPVPATPPAPIPAGSVVAGPIKTRVRPAKVEAAEAAEARPATTGPGSLGEETKLVTAANAALRSGDGNAALGLVEEHQRRFPTGVLAEERDAQRVGALCLAGRTSDSRERAARFSRERPGSPLLAKVKATCAEKKL